jgi:hypothetical protein
VQDAVAIAQRHERLADPPQGAGHGSGDLVIVLFDVDEVGVAHPR